MDHPDFDYLLVTNPDTDETVATETTDEDIARQLAWRRWFGEQPVDERIQRFTLRPAVDVSRYQRPPARLN